MSNEDGPMATTLDHHGDDQTPLAADEAGWIRSGGQEAVRLSADALAWASRELRAHPGVGGVLLGFAGLGAALAIGVGELAVGLAIGFAGYRMLAKGESPVQAFRDALALEHGEDPDATGRKKHAAAR